RPAKTLRLPSFFFFQAEDGIRDFHVTGVQTCALPIWSWIIKHFKLIGINFLRGKMPIPFRFIISNSDQLCPDRVFFFLSVAFLSPLTPNFSLKTFRKWLRIPITINNCAKR